MRILLRTPLTALCGLAAICLVLLTASACTAPEPDSAALFNHVDVRFAGELRVPSVLNTSELAGGLVVAIQRAETSVDLAFESLDYVSDSGPDSESVADAMIAAAERGVRVRAVGDADRAGDAGFVRLVEAGIPVTFGDEGVIWSPQPGTDVDRPGDDNRMTHNFLIVDETRVYNFTAGLTATGAGQVGFEARSIDLARDFTDEFQQLFGGVFANTPSAYDGPVKSTTDARLVYPGNIADFGVAFGPQERLIKQMIDEVYSARASVWVITEEFTNRYLADALRYKAQAGFDVRVIIGFESAEDSSSDYDALNSNLAAVDTGAFASATGVEPVADTKKGANVGLTMIVIDALASPVDGDRYERRVMVSSQPILAAVPWNSANGTSRPADAFSDSNMWTIRNVPGGVDEAGDDLVRVFETEWQVAYE